MPPFQKNRRCTIKYLSQWVRYFFLHFFRNLRNFSQLFRNFANTRESFEANSNKLQSQRFNLWGTFRAKKTGFNKSVVTVKYDNAYHLSFSLRFCGRALSWSDRVKPKTATPNQQNLARTASCHRENSPRCCWEKNAAPGLYPAAGAPADLIVICRHFPCGRYKRRLPPSRRSRRKNCAIHREQDNTSKRLSAIVLVSQVRRRRRTS